MPPMLGSSGWVFLEFSTATLLTENSAKCYKSPLYRDLMVRSRTFSTELSTASVDASRELGADPNFSGKFGAYFRDSR
jgi:hypothetical protein